ncbi:MAG: 50S ribosomal protein L17 [Candidatus Dadabacteria bacterium]|nr:MAG: 50S ribosomal protein L17 [Candidatus Dadabacteria bacterium]
MRHRKSYRKFGRSAEHRKAMFRNMATSLLLHEQLKTTEAKAKDLRSVVEKLITLAGNDTLHARRRAYSYLLRKDVVRKLFSEIGPRYKSRPGGYTRVIKTIERRGDGARMAVIQLVEEELKPKKKAAAKSRKKSSKAKAAGKSGSENAGKKAKAESAKDVDMDSNSEESAE